MSDRRAYCARWTDLPRWDLKSARAAVFRALHPDFRPLGDFIEEATVTVRPADEPEKLWPVYGVNNRVGVVLSHYQPGKEFNAPYKHIERDWFFHNPTRANVGSLGRVPEVPPDALTSPEYQVWRIRHGLLPDFVEILIRLPFFLDLVECHRVGAVKERLFVENLKEIPIPPLSEAEQRGIVKRWQDQHRSVEDAHERARTLRRGADAQFLETLGFDTRSRKANPKCLTVRWSQAERWGVGFNQQVATALPINRGKYEPRALGSLAELVQYGTSEKANTVQKGSVVLRMNNVKDGEFDFTDLKHIELDEREVRKLELRDGDLLINRTNSKELVGKAAVFHEPMRCVFASYLIRMRLATKVADPDFVVAIVNGPIGRQQVDAMSRQILGQANINSEELRSLLIPLPPLAEQRALVERVAAARTEIARERAEADRLAAAIAAETEALLLGPRRIKG